MQKKNLTIQVSIKSMILMTLSNMKSLIYRDQQRVIFHLNLIRFKVHNSKIIQIEIITVLGGLKTSQKTNIHNSFIETVDEIQKGPHIIRHYLIENVQKDLDDLTQDKINQVMLSRIRHKTVDTITIFDTQQDSEINEITLTENKNFKNPHKLIHASTGPKKKLNETVKRTINQILDRSNNGMQVISTMSLKF